MDDPFFDYPPATSTYRDIRSIERARNFQRKASDKYYGFRSHKPSHIGQPYLSIHLSIPGRTESIDLLDQNYWHYMVQPGVINTALREGETSDESPTLANLLQEIIDKPRWYGVPKIEEGSRLELVERRWTKADAFATKDMDIWPLDRRHHHGKKVREKADTKWYARQVGRGTRQAHRYMDWQCEGVHEIKSDDHTDAQIRDDWLWHERRERWWDAIKEELFWEDVTAGEVESDQLSRLKWEQEMMFKPWQKSVTAVYESEDEFEEEYDDDVDLEGGLRVLQEAAIASPVLSEYDLMLDADTLAIWEIEDAWQMI